jgi:L-rhamnose 1-dehydrogenase
MQLHDKVALVTGGSRGVGAAIAVALARAGAKVALNYHPEADRAAGRAAAGMEVSRQIEAAGGECLLLPADIADGTQAHGLVERTVEHFGSLHIVVCNAGVCTMRDFLDVPLDVFDRTHAVNLRAHFIICQDAARIMLDQKQGGRFIAISSVSARVGGAQQAHYCPTKSGLHSLMQSMAIALGPHGITCNSIGPGEVDTDMNRMILGYEQFWAELDKRLPLRRVAQPSDIADPVVFLASDASRYITGQLIMVDGGMLNTILCG